MIAIKHNGWDEQTGKTATERTEDHRKIRITVSTVSLEIADLKQMGGRVYTYTYIHTHAQERV